MTPPPSLHKGRGAESQKISKTVNARASYDWCERLLSPAPKVCHLLKLGKIKKKILFSWLPCGGDFLRSQKSLGYNIFEFYSLTYVAGKWSEGTRRRARLADVGEVRRPRETAI